MPALEIRSAQLKDVDAIVRLVNRAFVAESPYIEGERINADGVRSAASAEPRGRLDFIRTPVTRRWSNARPRPLT